MGSGQNIQDIAIGTGGVTSFVWYPALAQINEIAACVVVVGGALLMLIRLYFSILAWCAYRKNGKLPKV